ASTFDRSWPRPYSSDPRRPPRAETDSARHPLPGAHHVEDAIGIRVLQRVAVRVRGEIVFREVRSVAFPLEQELSLLETHANAFPGDAGHLRGQEDRGIRQDHIDDRIPRPDLFPLESRPRHLLP